MRESELENPDLSSSEESEVTAADSERRKDSKTEKCRAEDEFESFQKQLAKDYAKAVAAGKQMEADLQYLDEASHEHAAAVAAGHSQLEAGATMEKVLAGALHTIVDTQQTVSDKLLEQQEKCKAVEAECTARTLGMTQLLNLVAKLETALAQSEERYKTLEQRCRKAEDALESSSSNQFESELFQALEVVANAHCCDLPGRVNLTPKLNETTSKCGSYETALAAVQTAVQEMNSILAEAASPPLICTEHNAKPLRTMSGSELGQEMTKTHQHELDSLKRRVSKLQQESNQKSSIERLRECQRAQIDFLRSQAQLDQMLATNLPGESYPNPELNDRQKRELSQKCQKECLKSIDLLM
jgi:hypothetical protein